MIMDTLKCNCLNIKTNKHGMMKTNIDSKIIQLVATHYSKQYREQEGGKEKRVSRHNGEVFNCAESIKRSCLAEIESLKRGITSEEQSHDSKGRVRKW